MKIFWINILLVWVAFAIFGALAFVNIGFGLLIIIFSVMNCILHILQGVRFKRWNPGLIASSFQFVISIYAAYLISSHGVSNAMVWWVAGTLFSILVHVVLFRIVMK